MSDNNPRVRVVDDERAIRSLLLVTPNARDFVVSEAFNARETRTSAADKTPDVIILDLGVPDVDGVDVIRQLREWTQTPVIVLSGRGSEDDKISALNSGADDYLTKPCSMGELIARINVVMRRAIQPPNKAVFKKDKLKVDIVNRLVTLDDREIHLTPNEYELLRVFVSHAGKVLTYSQLLREIWGPGHERKFHLLQVNISNIRAKIEPEPGCSPLIITEPGVGYRFKVN
jgi:two-component system, OmpR family, KDP operon response regulator KdpE